MFEKGTQKAAEWVTMPVEEEPPGGFPIIFAYSRKMWLYSFALIGAVFCIFLVFGWHLDDIPKTKTIVISVCMFPLLLLSYYSQSAMHLYSDHFVMALREVPYRDIQEINIQTTLSGHPIRMMVKLPSRTVYLEGFVCMDVLARELLARAKTQNELMQVEFHSGPTAFQLRLLTASIAVIAVFLIMIRAEVDHWVWIVAGMVTVIGIHVVLHRSFKDLRPKPSPLVKRLKLAAYAITFLLPFIAVGILFFYAFLHTMSVIP